jgi:hypothetical protein
MCTILGGHIGAWTMTILAFGGVDRFRFFFRFLVHLDWLYLYGRDSTYGARSRTK